MAISLASHSVPNAAEPLLQARGICKSYHLGKVSVPVLQDVSLEVRRGEMISLMGPSGCGKSTLLSILGLLDKPSAGSYRFAGQDTASLSDDQLSRLRNEGIGFVFQAFHLIPNLNILENVCVPLQYRDLADREIDRLARDMLAGVGLGGFSHHRPTELSGGQQQRVAVARALVGGPDMVLADEPTGALDSKTAAEIMLLLQQLNRESGVTVVLVTHDPQVARAAHRLYRIHDGCITDEEPGNLQ